MATVNSTLSLTDKMTNIFNNISNAAKKTENAFNNVDKKLNSMQNSSKKTSSSFTSMFKGMLLANVASSAISKLAGLIMGQLSDAVSRFDTLNNYVKVMHNLGVSEEAANASRDRLAEGLKGLPTTLDTAALAVQRFTAANENVEASTEMYLALNNALLAGGTAQELQASAMEQWAQAYSKGKPDMMEWRTLLQAMPGQLKQIAKAMGKTTDELGKDLRSGKTSMNDFMKTAVKLNQQGIEGFDSFEKQAKNATDGIGTAISNMKAAITRGWTKMFEGANKSLEASGLPKINEIITNLGNTIETTMEQIGSNVVPALGQSIQDITTQFNTWGAAVDEVSGNMVATAQNALTVMDIVTLAIEAFGLGAQLAIAGIQIALLSLYELGITIWHGLIAIFGGIAVGIQSAMWVAKKAAEDAVNFIIDKLNQLIDAFNSVFSALGASIPNLSNVYFGSGEALESAIEGYGKYSDTLGAFEKEMNTTADTMKSLASKSSDNLYNGATRFQNSYSSRLANSVGTTSKNKVTGNYDPSNIDKLANTVGNSGSGSGGGGGGKAVKTTSTDSSLLKDDDIKLLLDVATRDYKLNYQQVTPNITLTFGDIRETVDVDDVLDSVADKLEEIYDGNLEVA